MKKINHRWLLVTAFITLILIGTFVFFILESKREHSEVIYQEVQRQNSNMMKNMMGNEQDTDLKVVHQTEKNLLIPPVLKPSSEKEGKITYDIVARKGEFQIVDGEKTATLGYNGDFLGPVIRLRKGQKVTINTNNQLNSRTSFHWHGLKIPSNADGGPHQILEPGENKSISFEVTQEASTLWFHPHPEGETASQVYKGLAGLMYIDDENSKSLDVPSEYGVDDIPLIVQDKSFTSSNQINYESDYNSDGTKGEVLLTNGTINPYVEISTRWIRYRIVSGSNSRNFTFSLDNNKSFYQIATDGGFLNSPVKLTSLTLSPGERAEILIDTQSYEIGEITHLLADDSVALTMKIRDKKQNIEFSPSGKLNNINKIDEKEIQKLARQVINLKGMSHMVNINSKKFDRDRIDLYKEKDTQEIWEVNNINTMMGGMIHPFHIHGVQFQIVSRNGKKPSLNEIGWKDTVLVNPEEKVELLVKFDHEGIFMYHCHILEHEEYGMMGQMEVK
ncbi:multicopper oxidase family protein [Enterococcus casseliflavus]|uniref:multicopper oxidase family protein n=1 Tax=Enterococcus casseliflavus TaxID=37734 RepID=UPI00232E015A|nr:multicopper oxidase domain-containing protein [Enterococcus casseliflavus]MDB1688214.1 multicopper oxidase domain-containing protein [Enterococcus casseliflavus]